MASIRSRISRIYFALIRRELIVCYFVLLSLLLIYALQRINDLSAIELFTANKGTIVCCLALSFLYACVKAVVWCVAWRSQEMNIPFLISLKIFYVSAFIDLLVFPSRLSSDVYRATYLNEFPLRNRIRSIVLFRVGATLPYLLIVTYYLIQNRYFLLMICFLLIGLFGLWKKGVARQVHFLAEAWLPLLVVFTSSLFLIFVDFFRAFFILAIFDYHATAEFLLWWGVSYTIGTASGLPLGLGPTDASLAFYLNEVLSAHEITIFLVLLRVTGEIFSAAIGWILSGKDTIEMIKRARSH